MPRLARTAISRETWLFWIVAVLVLGAGLGLRDPWPADEPRFALVARQMVDSGDWLFPHRGGELYSDKPPLFMWLQAAAYTVIGNWRVAFLLPSLLAALGTLWCVIDLGRRLWTRRVGLYAGWAVLLALQFTWQAKKAQIDPLVVFWITLANYGLLRHVLTTRSDPGPNWSMWALGWAAAGFGTISKGVGAIALLMLVPAGIAAVRGWPVRLYATHPRFWLGPLAFVAACGVWLVPMLVAALGNGSPDYRTYMDDILLRQTAKRYAASWHHAQPAWYFLEVMATMWLPTALALPWAVPAWRRRLRRVDPRYLLPLAWWLLVLVFFTIPSGKRDMYILPALPMAALALAPLLPGLLRRVWPRRLALGFAAALGGVALVAGLTMWFGDPGFERHLVAQRGLENEALALAGLLVAIGAWGVASVLWFGRRRPIAALVSTLAGLWVLFGLIGAPLLNDSSSARGLMVAVGRRIGADAELGLVAWREQHLLMADRAVAEFGFKRPFDEQMRRGLAWQAQRPASRWLLVQDAAMVDCIDRRHAQALGNANRRSWWLLPGAATAACADAMLTPTAPPSAASDDDGDADDGG
ncbi:glycosyltransferase family 39 protein [Lysobacter psychrotolerans]|uniref:Glycosyltransferase family 39 protein n=1 Tax=Montanilutibacter psychrotolerans TaxID=1327343 RepID=A0A3M8STE3_9GAMM|nr:glycosyltransferase family 39 protein [Lysobacter psychrotolerans]RNF84578.1 glycosyltransferase family 39 protein [Lysobacter psychrotolerans]